MAGGHLIRLAERAAPRSRAALRPSTPTPVDPGRTSALGDGGLGAPGPTVDDTRDARRDRSGEAGPPSDGTPRLGVDSRDPVGPPPRSDRATPHLGTASSPPHRPGPAPVHVGDGPPSADPARVAPTDPPPRLMPAPAPRFGGPAVAAATLAPGGPAKGGSSDAERDRPPASDPPSTAAEPAVLGPAPARRPTVAIFELPTRPAPTFESGAPSTPVEEARRPPPGPTAAAGPTVPAGRPRPAGTPRERPGPSVDAGRRVVQVRIGHIEIAPNRAPEPPARTTVLISTPAPHPLDGLTALRSWSERGDR